MIEVAGDLTRLLPALERAGLTVDDVLVITSPTHETRRPPGVDSARVEVTGPTGLRHGVRIEGSRVGPARVSWCSLADGSRRLASTEAREGFARSLAASDARARADTLEVGNDEVRALLELRTELVRAGVTLERAVAATGALDDGSRYSVELAVGVREVSRRGLELAAPYLETLRRVLLDVEHGTPLEWALRPRGVAS